MLYQTGPLCMLLVSQSLIPIHLSSRDREIKIYILGKWSWHTKSTLRSQYLGPLFKLKSIWTPSLEKEEHKLSSWKRLYLWSFPIFFYLSLFTIPANVAKRIERLYFLWVWGRCVLQHLVGWVWFVCLLFTEAWILGSLQFLTELCWVSGFGALEWRKHVYEGVYCIEVWRRVG